MAAGAGSVEKIPDIFGQDFLRERQKFRYAWSGPEGSDARADARSE
jgi:hypothetical protein